jgi:acyl carrier protein
MTPNGRTYLEINHSLSGAEKEISPAEDAQLREALKRCSPCTYYAAYQFRLTGDPARLPAIVVGVIERYVEPALRAKLREPSDGLRLAEDLAIDSLTLMEIVLLAEEVLPLSIANEELRHLRTLGEVQRFVAEKVSAPAARAAVPAPRPPAAG